DLEQARSAAWNTLPKLANQAHITRATMANLGSLLGQDRNRRYLLLFLNNTELRPGGGFIGSFASFILKKGDIDQFNVQTNIYKQDNAFAKTNHIDAPYPLNSLSDGWYMRDAN